MYISAAEVAYASAYQDQRHSSPSAALFASRTQIEEYVAKSQAGHSRDRLASKLF